MELKGKNLSLLSKILALAFVLVSFILMATTDIKITADDAIKVATFIALVFSPVDVSLWIENITGRRHHNMSSCGEGEIDEEPEP